MEGYSLTLATRLYFHAATSTVSGTLPATEQSTLTSTNTADAVTVNRSMDTTIGTAQASVAVTTTGVTAKTDYLTKFISTQLNQTSIAANTWTLNFAAKQSASTMSFPRTPHPNIYVWRPSTGAKIASIADANTANVTAGGAGVEVSQNVTISGASATCQVNDVIVVEIWALHTPSQAASSVGTLYFDGTTVTTSSGTTVSNHASFLQTPEDITFVGGAPASIDMTPNLTTYTNKIITKI